jgi:hypothetical protein
MKNSFDVAAKFSNAELRSLLKEASKISCAHAPANVKQSTQMQELFEAENYKFYTWADKFINVKRAIEVEILQRVKNSTL